MAEKKQTMLVQVTLPEMLEAIEEIFQKYQPNTKVDSKDSYTDLPRLITGIKDAARVLGVSSSTIARWKKSGEYDDCIFQDGKIVRFDTHKMLEKMRTSNRKGKYGNFRSNQQISQIWKKK